MADTSLRARLGRLFSTNVIVRRISKNRLKVVDSNRLQSVGTSTNSYIDRFARLQTSLLTIIGIFPLVYWLLKKPVNEGNRF